MTTQKRLSEILAEIKKDSNYSKAGELVNAMLDYEDYCAYNLTIENCEYYLGDDNMAMQWLLDEGGYNLSCGEHSIKDLAILLDGLDDSDDERGFFCLNVYGYLYFIDYIQALDDIINDYCVNNEEAAKIIIEKYKE